MCIGVPILDGAGRPIPAISLAAPERRITPAVTERATAALLDAANRISTRLGAPPPQAARMVPTPGPGAADPSVRVAKQRVLDTDFFAVPTLTLRQA